MATGTSCPACTAVATGGRIRINEDDADLLDELLAQKRHELLVLRRSSIDNGEASAVGVTNLVIRQIDRIGEEIARTRTEKGWLTSHEPERSHPS
jgi:hypothetical protein